MNKKTAKSKFSKGIRTIACFTLLVTIVLSTVGCDALKDKFGAPYGNIYNPYIPYTEYVGIDKEGTLYKKQGTEHEHFSMGEVKPKETVEQDGITPQDVLSLYDLLILDIVEIGEIALLPEIYQYYNKLSVQFTSITVDVIQAQVPKQDNGYGIKYYYWPFYIKSEFFYPDGILFRESMKLSGNTTYPYYTYVNVYPTSISGDFVIDNKIYSNHFDNFGIAGKDFERVMDAFNVESSIWEECDIALGDYSDSYFKDCIGYKKYSPIIINRELIENANEEQLWALYDMVDSMYTINFAVRPTRKK